MDCLDQKDTKTKTEKSTYTNTFNIERFKKIKTVILLLKYYKVLVMCLSLTYYVQHT